MKFKTLSQNNIITIELPNGAKIVLDSKQTFSKLRSLPLENNANLKYKKS